MKKLSIYLFYNFYVQKVGGKLREKLVQAYKSFKIRNIKII